MEFARQEYWSGLPCHDLPDPGIKPTALMSPALAGGFFTTSTTWEAPVGTMSTFSKLLATLKTAVTRLKPHTTTVKIQTQFWPQNLYILLFWSSWPFRSPESERRRGGRTAKWWLMWAPQSVSQGFHLRLHVLAIGLEQVNFIFLFLWLLIWARPREFQVSLLTTGASQIKTLLFPLPSYLCPDTLRNCG